MNKPEHIFNAGKSGIDLNALSGKVNCSLKAANMPVQDKRHQEIISLFSCMVCCSASGQVLRLMIIFEKNWPSGPYSRNGPDGCLYGKSPNRYMDE